MMDNAHRLLVACDDDARRSWLAEELTADGYSVASAGASREAGIKAREHEPEAIVIAPLDHPLAQLELVRAIRNGSPDSHGIDPRTGIVCLGAGGELELARLLEAGSDDYLRPKADFVELRHRLRSLLRRIASGHGRRYRCDGLAVNPDAHTVSWHDEPVHLSRMEFALLAYLAADPDRTATKADLLEQVWGFQSLGRTRTVDAHACRLRRRLAAVGAEGFVISVRGVGYRLRDPDSARQKPAPALRAA